MQRVRRQTRPYVGAMDWYDTVNTNPFSAPIIYYGIVDINEYFYPNRLWRWRNEDEGLYEEVWNSRTKSWQSTLYLTRMVTGGNAGLSDMPEEQARKLVPEAFTEEVI